MARDDYLESRERWKALCADKRVRLEKFRLVAERIVLNAIAAKDGMMLVPDQDLIALAKLLGDKR